MENTTNNDNQSSQAPQSSGQNMTMGTGMEQIQDAGKAGLEKMGQVVGQVIQPQKPNQPPVTKDEKIYAAISYVPFVALISIIIKPDSAFVRLHAKQGLLLAMIFFFIGIFAAIVSLFGLIGQILAFLLGLVPLATLITDGYSMYLAFTGYWWKIPVLGTVADVIPVEWMAKTSKENLTGQVGVAKVDYDVRQEAMKQEKAEAQAPQMANVNMPQTQEPVQNTIQATNTSGVPNQTALPTQNVETAPLKEYEQNAGAGQGSNQSIQGNEQPRQ